MTPNSELRTPNSLSTQISNQIKKYLKGRYAIGDPSNGWDCLNLFVDFYRAFGYEFPPEFGGINEVTYADLWKNDNDLAIDLYESFFLSLGDPVEITYYVRGDLLLFKAVQLRLFPAIALGNGHMFMMGKDGPVVVPFRPYRKYLAAVRRLISA